MVGSLKIFKIHRTIIISVVIIFILNIINCIEKEKGIMEYFFNVISFALVLIIYCIFRHYKKHIIHSIIFITASAVGFLMGGRDSLAGITFLCFAIYSLKEDPNIIIILLVCSFITIILKMLITPDLTVTIAITYLVGCYAIFGIYYDMIHPKKYDRLSTLNEDYVNVQIIGLLITGYRAKEIADKVNLSENAIVKRIKNMREKYECGNNEEMIFYLIKKGKIRLN